jgi:hypothetical protein
MKQFCSFIAIGYVDPISKFKSFSVRIDGMAICPAETTGVIPTKNTPCLITALSKVNN